MTDDKYDGACMRLSRIGYKIAVDRDTFLENERVVYTCKLGHEGDIALATMNNTYKKNIDSGTSFCKKCRQSGLSLEEIDKLTCEEVKNKPEKIHKEKRKDKPKSPKKKKDSDNESSDSENSIDTIKSVLEEEKEYECILDKCSCILRDLYELSYDKIVDKKDFNYNFRYQYSQEEYYEDVKDEVVSHAKKFSKIIRMILKKFNIEDVDKSYHYKIIMEFISSKYTCIQSRKMLKFLFERVKHDNAFMVFGYQRKVIDKLKEDRKLLATDIQTGVSDGCPILEYIYKDSKMYWYPDIYIPKENKIIDVYHKSIYEKFKDHIDTRIKKNKEYVSIELWIDDGKEFEITNY